MHANASTAASQALEKPALCIETHATGTEDGEREESLSRDGDKKTGLAPFIFLARFRIWMTTCPSCIRVGFLSVTHPLNDKLRTVGGVNEEH